MVKDANQSGETELHRFGTEQADQFVKKFWFKLQLAALNLATVSIP